MSDIKSLEFIESSAQKAPFSMPSLPKQLAPKREPFVGFVSDEVSATVLHQALSPAFPHGLQIHVVDFRTSLNILAGMTTPEIVLIDVSGEDQPMNAVMDLAEVVDPGTTVLAIGETHNLNFYRTVTKGMGVKEYLRKPLTSERVERNFLELLQPAKPIAEDPAKSSKRSGRMIAIAGLRGGTGCSTVANNLAWMIGVQLHRHTLLLDSDLHAGTTALDLNVQQDKGLCIALENPERMDSLLLERAARPAGGRLHVLSASEELSKDVRYAKNGAASLGESLRGRFNYVIADAGSKLSPFSRDLLHLAHQRVLVLDPTFVAIRNLERLGTLSGGPLQSPRVMLVLNQAGRPGGMSQSAMERLMGVKFDAVIPDLPRIVPKAAQFGTPAAELRGPFRNAISKLATALGASTHEPAAA